MEKIYDVIVIGGSLAGASAAMELSRAGRSVCLIDRAQFPRPKPCGEGLSPRGAAILAEFGLGPVIESQPHDKLGGYSIGWYYDGGIEFNEIEIPFSDKEGSATGMGIRRTLLDAAVHQHCRGLDGVDVVDCFEVKTIERSDGFTVGSSANVRIKGRKLIAADGASSPCSRLLGLGSNPADPKRSAVVETYGGNWIVPPGQVNIFMGRGVHLFLTPVGEGCLCAAYIASPGAAGILKSAADREQMLLPALERIGYCRSELLDRRGASALGHRRRSGASDGIYLAGDALEQLDPVGGMGMTHALLSGRIAARSAALELAGETSAEAARFYQREREKAVIPLRGFTRLVVGAFACADRLRPARALLGLRLSAAASREVHGLGTAGAAGVVSRVLLHAAGCL